MGRHSTNEDASKIFNPYESADVFIHGAKLTRSELVRSELVSSRIFDRETLLSESPYT